MDGFLSSFAKELRPEWNIHLSSLLPGGVDTDYIRKSVIFLDQHQAYSDQELPKNHMLRMIHETNYAGYPKPKDLVDVVVDVIHNGEGELGIPLRIPLGEDSWTLIHDLLQRTDTEHQQVKAISLRPQIDEKLIQGVRDRFRE